jgi:hypothetical protein
MPSYYNDNVSYYSYECEIEYDDISETEKYEEQDPYMTYDEEMEAFADEEMEIFADTEDYINDDE